MHVTLRLPANGGHIQLHDWGQTETKDVPRNGDLHSRHRARAHRLAQPALPDHRLPGPQPGASAALVARWPLQRGVGLRTGKYDNVLPVFGLGSGPSLAFVPPRCSRSVLCWVSPNVFPAGGDNTPRPQHTSTFGLEL